MKKAIKIIFLSVLMCFTLTFVCFAEEEAKVSPNYDDGWQSFYKNFIVDIGMMRIRVFSSSMDVLFDKTVAPKQFQGKKVVEIDRGKVKGEKDSIYMNKQPVAIDVSNCAFSNNIPQLYAVDDSGGNDSTEKKVFYFSDWSNFKDIEEWKNYNDGENLNLLADDIFTESEKSTFKNIDDGSQMKFKDWLYQVDGSGFTPTLVIEPVATYPETTEQIFCSNLGISKQHLAKSFSCKWKTKGFWINYQKRTRETVYTEKQMQEKYKTELLRLQKVYGRKQTEDDLPFETFLSNYGYEREGDGYVERITFGLGDSTKIDSDHHQYIVVVYESEDELVKKMQEKYGCKIDYNIL